MANGKEDKKEPEFYYRLQESKAYLALRLLALQAVVALVGVAINLGFASTPDLEDPIFLASGLSVAHIILQAVNALVVVLLIINWLHGVYIITSQEVVVQGGLVAVGRTVFKAEKIESINVQQSLLGGLFNYGTITFYSPLLKEEVRIKNISDPIKYASALENTQISSEPPSIIAR